METTYIDILEKKETINAFVSFYTGKSTIQELRNSIALLMENCWDNEFGLDAFDELIEENMQNESVDSSESLVSYFYDVDNDFAGDDWYDRAEKVRKNIVELVKNHKS